MKDLAELMRRLGLGPEGLHGMSGGELQRQLDLQRYAQQQQSADENLRQQSQHYQRLSQYRSELLAKEAQSECCVHGWYRPTCPICVEGMRQAKQMPVGAVLGQKQEAPLEYPGPLVPHPTPPERGFYWAEAIPPASMLLAGVLALLMVL